MKVLRFLALVCIASAARYTRFGVDDPLAVCNDGSPYVFYLQTSADAPWLVFFQGGAWCFDLQSCNERMQQSPQLMSSRSYGPVADFGAALDDDPAANPVFAAWNKVVLPYCTSDDFSGARNATSSDPWLFQGSRVLPAVLVALQRRHGLRDGGTVVLAGSSAGGEALYPNVDLVSERLLPHSEVLALDDSGYFLSSAPYQGQTNCTSPFACTEQEGIRLGVAYWNAQLNARCVAARPPARAYECLLGPTALPFLRTPVFVFQYLFDAAQLAHDGLGDPSGNADKMRYAAQSASNLTTSLARQPYVFLPACFTHTVLGDRDWTKMAIDGVLLTDAVKAFLARKPALRLVDSCTGSVRCNPTCPGS